MKKLIVLYKEWRKVSEEMITDGFRGSIDCGEKTVREDFSAYAELKEEISFEEMFELEKEYSNELVESAKEPLSENTLIWDEAQRKLSQEKRRKHEAVQKEYLVYLSFAPNKPARI